MVADVLRRLVGITSVHTRRADQTQANGIFVWLVGTVLAICQNGRAKFTTHIGEIDPLMRRDLEFAWLSAGPLNRADVPVVGGHAVGSTKRESCFEVRFLRVPVDDVGELDPLACISSGKANCLSEGGSGGLAGNFQCDADRTSFNNANLGGATHITFRRSLLLVPIHVPRGPLLRIIVRDCQPYRRGEEFFS